MLLLPPEAEALNADISRLRAVDLTALDATGQVNLVEALLTATNQLHALTASLLAAAHASDATVIECGRAPRSWLVEEQRLGPRAASNRMRLAHGLPSAPAARDAFEAGTINDEHALVIVATLAKVPDDMREVVDKAMTELAREMPPHQLAAAVDEILARLGVETSEEERFRRRYERRGVSLDTTFGGFGSLSGTLSPEAAELVRLALAAAGAPTGPEDDRDASQRRHDALAEIAARYLETETRLPDTNGERPRVIVTIDLDTLLGRLTAKWATLETGIRIAPATARRLACDAEILPAVLGSRGEVLDIGRATRVWTTAQIRATKIRDQHRCTFPDCTRPPARLHHLQHWADGGPTSTDNGAWLCVFHHWLVHEGGWTAQRDPDGLITFTAPDGKQRRQHRRPDAA